MNPKEAFYTLLFMLSCVVSAIVGILIDKIFKLSGGPITSAIFLPLIIILNVVFFRLNFYERYYEKVERFLNKNRKIIHIIVYSIIVLLLVAILLPFLY